MISNFQNTSLPYHAHNRCHPGKYICLLLTSSNLVDKISNTPNITHDITRAILNFFAFSSEILRATLALSAFHFATSPIARACFNSLLASSTLCSNRRNFANTIGVVAAPRVQVLVSNHLKNLHARSSPCTIK